MVRQTSIDAYREIESNGLLSLRRWEVYKYVFENGPISANEMCRTMLKQGKTFSSYNARFSELRNLGVLQEVGTKKDENTNQTVIIWDVTSRLPSKREKQDTEATAIIRAVSREAMPMFLPHDLVRRIDKYLRNK